MIRHTEILSHVKIRKYARGWVSGVRLKYSGTESQDEISLKHTLYAFLSNDAL